MNYIIVVVFVDISIVSGPILGAGVPDYMFRMPSFKAKYVLTIRYMSPTYKSLNYISKYILLYVIKRLLKHFMRILNPQVVVVNHPHNHLLQVCVPKYNILWFMSNFCFWSNQRMKSSF